jgi:lysophospholipase L1-like esterase
MYTGDLKPDLRVTLSAAGPVDVTEAENVRIIGKRGDHIVFDRAPDTQDVVGDTSVLTMLWQDGDTDTKGRIQVEVEVTWPGDERQTFRANGGVDIYTDFDQLALTPAPVNDTEAAADAYVTSVLEMEGTAWGLVLQAVAAGNVGNVNDDDPRLSDARPPTGGAGGVLSGSFPNPGFAVDMAEQGELNAHTGNTSNPHSVTAAQVGSRLDPLRYDATKLRAWRAALGARATTPVDILPIGDSLVEGQGASASTKRWTDLLRDDLRTRFQPAGVTGGEGYVPGFYVVPGITDRWVTTGTVAMREDLGGLGERTLVVAAGGTAELTFNGTGIDHLYEKGPVAGTFSWKIDAGSATNVNAASGTLSGGNVVQVRGLSAASHTLTITAVSSNTYIEGAMVYNGDESAGIRMWGAGHSGWQSDDLANTGSVDWFESVTPVQPDLVIIHLGLNDFGSQSQARISPTAMKTNIATLLTNVRAKCTIPPSVVLAIPYERFLPTGTLLAPWSDYRTALAEAAAADGNVALLDLGNVIGTFNPTDPYSLSAGDGVHPNDRGYRAIADAFTALLTAL